MKQFLFCTLFILQVFPGLSQSKENVFKEGILSGSVVNAASQKPMEYVNIILIESKDSSLVNGTVSNVTGNFKIEKIPTGKYYCILNFIGFEKITIPDLQFSAQSPSINLGVIRLSPGAKQLDNVDVIGEKEQFENFLEKKVINADKDIISRGGTARDILENAPSISTNINGELTMRGAELNVLINGKPSILSGNELLQQISANTIEKIEVITNPSAKFDPDGLGGIVNIITKKREKAGITGLFNTSVGVRDKYSADGMFQIKKGKFNIYTGIDWRYDNYLLLKKSNFTTFFPDRDEVITTNTDGSHQRKDLNFNGGIDFQATKNALLSFSGTYGNYGFGRESTTQINQEQESRVSVVRALNYLPNLLNLNDATRDGYFYNLNANYTQTLGENGHEISFHSFLGHQNGTEEDRITDYESDSSWNIVGDALYSISAAEEGTSNEFRAQVDYKVPMGEHAFEVGIQYRSDVDDKQYQMLELDPVRRELVENDLFSNQYDLNRKIFAGYFNLSQQVLEFNFEFGLRGEYTDRAIRVHDIAIPYNLRQFNLFPNVSLSRKLSKSDQIRLSYNRRINRPRDYYLEPFVVFYNRFIYRQGNPVVVPELANSVELNYQKRIKSISISFEPYYRHTKNTFSRIRDFYSQNNNTFLYQFTNLGDDYSIGAELTGSFSVDRWLRIMLSTNVFNYRMEGVYTPEPLLNAENDLEEILVSDNSTNIHFRVNSSITITPTLRAQLSWFYMSRTVTTQGSMDNFYFLNAALRKDFFDKKLTASLQIRDIFGSMEMDVYSFRENSNGVSFENFDRNKREPQILILSLSYKLNKYKGRKSSGEQIELDYGDDY